MARHAGEVWGIETVPEAIADAEENARRNGIANAHFMAGDARTSIRSFVERAGPPDVVVVDPRAPGSRRRCAARDRVRREAHRRLVQPDDAGASMAGLVEPDIGCGACARGHVPPNPAHRVRGPSETTLSTRGFGVAAGLDPSVAEPLAALRDARLLVHVVQRHPGGGGLETIASFAAAVPGIDFGVAVLALDRRTPEEIAEKILDLGLPPERLWIGVGRVSRSGR